MFASIVVLMLISTYAGLLVGIKWWVMRQQRNLLASLESTIGCTVEFILHREHQQDAAIAFLKNKKKMLIMMTAGGFFFLALAACMTLPLVVDDNLKVINIISERVFVGINITHVVALGVIYGYHLKSFSRYLNQATREYEESVRHSEQAARNTEALLKKSPKKADDEDYTEAW